MMNGWDMKTQQGVKLKMINDMIAQRGINVMVITETRVRQEETEAIRGHCMQNGLEYQRTCGRLSEKDRICYSRI